MRDVVIDTDVASLLQKRQAPPWVLRQLADARVWLTFVTVGELAKWAVARKWGQDRRGRLEAWVATRPVIPYDSQIAWVWGELAGSAQLRGRPRPQNDTWIAACCLRYQVPLVTLNTADFGDFATHHGLVLLGERA
jgi:predicted nucleic acid-binding protein